MSTVGVLGPILYGALFVVALPVALLWWAGAAGSAVPLPRIHLPIAGTALVASGLALMTAGAKELILRGRGLPMNAFPPIRLVQSGIFRWIRNPMYIGFGLALTGASLFTGSASGLWLVTPVAVLAAAALVWGYERLDLVRRFGREAARPPLLSLPRGGPEPPEPLHRGAVFVWVLVPWAISWFAIQALGRPPDAFGTALLMERNWPVWQWTEAVYLSTYLFVPAAVFLARTQRVLRRFALSGLIGTVVVTLCWLVIPVAAVNRPFEASTVLGRFLAFEQRTSTGMAAFPAFHVLWPMIAAGAWQDRGRIWGMIGWLWTGLIALSCLTTGMHSVIEVGAGLVLFVPLRDPAATWAAVRRATERLANSWHEWRLGPLRLINHALYAALAGAVGFLIIASAMGTEHLGTVLWVSLWVILGAGLWAQLLEGSSSLLRPFGWYGGVVGGVAGALTARLLGAPVMPALAGLALAAPWIQILGRLRCLVQGCCHGGPTSEAVGIRYRHPRSRVTQLAHLANQPIHPTPLYSIAGNIVIGLLLFRLRLLGTSPAFLIGIYLILGGLARFVEEGYRAEPQTPVVARLHIYQWLAIVSVATGIWCTTLAGFTAVRGFQPIDARAAAGALFIALVTGFAMGVDFPRSDRRFSRLAATN